MPPRADHNGGHGDWSFDSEPDPSTAGWFMLALVPLLIALAICLIWMPILMHPLTPASPLFFRP